MPVRWNSALVGGVTTAMLALGGCETTNTAPPSTPNPPPQTDVQNESPVIEAARQTAAQPLEPSYPSIDTLTGQTAESIETLLGQPQFRRRDKPAELWQYRVTGCVLDLFLYPGAGRSLAVDFLDVRQIGNSDVGRQDCLVSLLKTKAAGVQG